jgi:signal transduction histidine kinase
VPERWPVAAAVAVSGGLVLARAAGQSHSPSGPAALLLVAPPLVAFALGMQAGVAAGLAGVVLMAAALQAAAGGAFNPLFEMLTLGPWLAGRVVRSRRRLAAAIAARNRELEAERALHVLESVRLERARIARELHDVVAHCVSVIVVQAGAGRRLPERAAEAFDAIAAAAEEARAELRVLDGQGERAPRPIEELVRRAAAAGLAVRYRPSGDLDTVRRPASEAAYRVVQESITNAIKHAPGAPIDIAVRAGGGRVAVEVVNAAAQAGPSGLERSGDSRGLAGMHRRVAACGGSLSAGPTGDGGWRVEALLPAPAAP